MRWAAKRPTDCGGLRDICYTKTFAVIVVKQLGLIVQILSLDCTAYTRYQKRIIDISGHAVRVTNVIRTK